MGLLLPSGGYDKEDRGTGRVEIGNTGLKGGWREMNEQLSDFLTIDDFDVEGKIVLFRADINSVVIDGKVQMKERILENAKTIRELSEKKARVVILAHQSRVGRDDFTSLEQHAQLLRNLLDLKFIDDIIGPAAREAIKNLSNGEILLLDNVRLLAEETLNKTPEEHSKSIFVQRLAPLADIYINDAFSVAHRSHASVVGFPKVLDAGIGRLMERELRALEKAVHSIERPCVYLLGGVKLEEVFDIIEFALDSGEVDYILTAGGIGNLFMYANGMIPMKVDKDLLESVSRAKRIHERAGNKIKYPWDLAIEQEGKREEIPVEQVKPNQPIYDIGQKTIEKYSEIIKNAKTVIMKGPAGFYEKEGFAEGTREIFKAISNSDAFSLLGGGHTSAAISEVGMDKREMANAHVSLAGGAFLRYLLGNQLPGIEVLKRH
ncbi:MAG: phosphoglycerate kinase [Candidatus Syntrophoarchaeum sp.]|nr:phosphoglycerate kinase [Candidatus Syntrophoarchaeum sp.]